jgi:hypothetical protein
VLNLWLKLKGASCSPESKDSEEVEETEWKPFDHDQLTVVPAAIVEVLVADASL